MSSQEMKTRRRNRYARSLEDKKFRNRVVQHKKPKIYDRIEEELDDEIEGYIEYYYGSDETKFDDRGSN